MILYQNYGRVLWNALTWVKSENF